MFFSLQIWLVITTNPRSPCTTGCRKSLLKGLFSWLPSLKLSIHQENHVLHLVWSCLNINYLKTILKVSLNSFTQKISGLWSERQAAYSPSPVFEEKNDHSPQPNTHPTKPTWADTMLKKTREIAPVVGGVRRWSEVPAQNRAMSLVRKIPPKLLLLLDGTCWTALEGVFISFRTHFTSVKNWKKKLKFFFQV